MTCRFPHPVRFAAGVAAIAVIACATTTKVDRTAPARPALAVMIAVDQLRADLLERYDPLFTGGFRRLRDRGFRFDRAVVDHGITNSLPGHVTLATGGFPSRHGIVNSVWAETVDGRPTGVFGVADDAAPIVGVPGLPGASPRRILVDGLPDWILRADPSAEVAAIGTGEYSSLLHAGHTRRTTYWFSPDAARYVTSAYYRDADPDWVTRFQDTALPALFARTEWRDEVPAAFAARAPRDAEPHEFDGVHVAFPHRFADERPKDAPDERRALAQWLYFTPMIDETTLGLAAAAVRDLHLGRRGHTDYLAVVVSAVDHVGHRYGPLSREQLDNLLVLDRSLGEFFRALDAAVGEGRYVVALSADHGSRDIPEAGRDAAGAGRRVTAAQLDAMMKAVDEGTARLDPAAPETARVAADIARRFDFVGGAVSAADLRAGVSADPIIALMARSYRDDRLPLTLGSARGSLASYGVVAWLAEGVVDDDAPSNHGSPWLYDRRVPLIFMGPGVRAGVSSDPARTVDVAPTLARLAGVAVPDTIDGQALL